MTRMRRPCWHSILRPSKRNGSSGCRREVRGPPVHRAHALRGRSPQPPISCSRVGRGDTSTRWMLAQVSSSGKCHSLLVGFLDWRNCVFCGRPGVYHRSSRKHAFRVFVAALEGKAAAFTERPIAFSTCLPVGWPVHLAEKRAFLTLAEQSWLSHFTRLGSFKGVLEILPDERRQGFVIRRHAIHRHALSRIHQRPEDLPGRCLVIEPEGHGTSSPRLTVLAPGTSQSVANSLDRPGRRPRSSR